MFVWQAHEGAVTSLAFVPNGGGLLSTGVDGTLRLWDPLTGGLVYHWKLAETAGTADDSDLLCVLVDATGRYATIGLRAHGVQTFDLQNYKVARELRFREIHALAPAADGKGFFFVGRDRGLLSRGREAHHLHQYGYEEDKVIASSRIGTGAGAIAVHPNRSEVIVGAGRFHWPSGKPAPHTIDGVSTEYAVSADGDKLFGMRVSRLVVWGFQLGFERRSLKGHIAPLTALTMTPDRRTLWTASADASVRQWDVETYKCEKWYGLKIGPLGCVAVSPDGLVGAAGSSLRGSIAMWDMG